LEGAGFSAFNRRTGASCGPPPRRCEGRDNGMEMPFRRVSRAQVHVSCVRRVRASPFAFTRVAPCVRCQLNSGDRSSARERGNRAINAAIMQIRRGKFSRCLRVGGINRATRRRETRVGAREASERKERPAVESCYPLPRAVFRPGDLACGALACARDSPGPPPPARAPARRVSTSRSGDSLRPSFGARALT
jgi:hypothetical protein